MFISDTAKLGAWGFAGVLATQAGQLLLGYFNHRAMTKQVRGVAEKADAAYLEANGSNTRLAHLEGKLLPHDE